MELSNDYVSILSASLGHSSKAKIGSYFVSEKAPLQSPSTGEPDFLVVEAGFKTEGAPTQAEVPVVTVKPSSRPPAFEESMFKSIGVDTVGSIP